MGDVFIINKKVMMDYVYTQLAIDYNCSPVDWLKDGLIFTEANEHKDRRPFPWRSPRLEMVAVRASYTPARCIVTGQGWTAYRHEFNFIY